MRERQNSQVDSREKAQEMALEVPACTKAGELKGCEGKGVSLGELEGSFSAGSVVFICLKDFAPG